MSKPRFEDETVRNFLFDSVEGQHAAFERWGLPISRVLILYNACGFQCFFCASEGTSFREESRRTPWSRIDAHLSPAQAAEDGGGGTVGVSKRHHDVTGQWSACIRRRHAFAGSSSEQIVGHAKEAVDEIHRIE